MMRNSKIHWHAMLLFVFVLCLCAAGALAEFTLAVGESRDLTCNIYYRDNKFVWVTGDTSIADIGRYNSRNTTITGKSVGKTYYQCYYYYYKLINVGSILTTIIETTDYQEVVNVKKAPYAVVFSSSEVTLPIGSSIYFQSPTFYPSGADCYEKIWTNSNASAATINAKTYKITGIAEGETTITLTLFNNLTASYKVKVIPPPLVISSVTTSATASAVNDPLSFTINASGGEGTKNFRFDVKRDGAIVKSTEFGLGDTLNYTPTEAGVYRVTGYVRDQTGTVQWNSSAVTVTVKPLSVSGCTITTVAPCVGTPMSIQASISGGYGTVRTQYTVYRNGSLVATSDAMTGAYTYTPDMVGQYYAVAAVTCGDEQGTATSATKTIGEKLAVSITTPPDCNATTMSDWSFTATGGYGDRYYSKTFIMDGKELTPSDFVKDYTGFGTHFTFKEETLRVAVKVTVKDKSGEATATSGVTTITREPKVLTITPPSVTMAQTGTSLTWKMSTTGGLINKEYYYKLYNGGTVVSTSTWATTSSFSYTPTVAGNYALSVTVRDKSETSVSKTSPVIKVYAPLNSATLTQSAVTVGVNVPVTWTASASDGNGDKQYYYELMTGDTLTAVTKAGTPVNTPAWGSERMFTYTPTQLGWCSLRVRVKDATGTSFSAFYAVRVVPAVTLNAVTSDAQTVTVGTPITWTASTSNGWGTKAFTGKVYLGSDVVDTQKSITENISNMSVEVAKPFTFTPTKAGTYALSVTVKDASGTLTKTSATVKVTPVPIVINAVIAAEATAGVGATVTWTTDASGGTGALLYSYKLYQGNTVLKTTDWAAEPTYTFVPEAEGSYALRVSVKDDYNTQTKTSAVLRVVPTSLGTPVVSVSARQAETGDLLGWKVATVGGYGQKQYYYQLYLGNKVINTPAWGTQNEFSYTVEQAGNYALRVSVKDEKTTQVKVSAVTAVTEAPLLLTEVNADVDESDTASTITWSVTSTGGIGKKQFSYKLYRGSTVCNTPAWTDDPTFTYAPTDAGSYALRVSARDSEDTQACTSAILRVTAAQLRVTGVTANTGDCAAGVPVTWTVSHTGGTGAKQYLYKLYQGANIINTPAWGSDHTFTFTPTESASYALSVTVRDATGSAAKVSAVTKVTAPLAIVSFNASATACAAGTSVTWTVTAQNGAGNRWYRYQLYRGNTVINTPVWGKENTFTAELPEAGNYALKVAVKDSTGSQSKVSAVTRVTAAQFTSNTVSIGQ